jgi:hypothetical protein
MDQFLLELKKLPRPQPILLGAVIAFLGMVLYAYREVIDYYWLPRWGDENGYYSYAYLVPPLALVMIWMRRERLLRLEARPSWWGVPLFLLAMGIHALGHWGYSSWVSSMASHCCSSQAACCCGAQKSRACYSTPYCSCT